MTRDDQQQRSAMRLLQNIVVVMVIGILTAVLLRYWFNSDSASWQQAELSVAQQRFSQNVGLIRARWMAQGKPKSVLLTTTNDETVAIKVNGHGWPDVSEGCDALWFNLTGQGLERGLVAVEENSICNYRLEGKTRFSYNARTGQTVQH
ncbi:hypothetical protein [Idiomarina sp.]|uniref:hypothetical protein n=1 Tax=Idiomarina sp. TaxID=1874361 RepID=UPI0025B9E9C0|nr:hypothetical protein [Idiomarina sp.]